MVIMGIIILQESKKTTIFYIVTDWTIFKIEEGKSFFS